MNPPDHVKRSIVCLAVKARPEHCAFAGSPREISPLNRFQSEYRLDISQRYTRATSMSANLRWAVTRCRMSEEMQQKKVAPKQLAMETARTKYGRAVSAL